MKEKEIYTAPDGTIHKILMFDELNKMVYINIVGTLHRWVHESEYSTWTVNDTAEMPKIYVPDIPAQMIEEQAESVEHYLEVDEIKPEENEPVIEEVKKKRTYKKKAE